MCTSWIRLIKDAHVSMLMYLNHILAALTEHIGMKQTHSSIAQ